MSLRKGPLSIRISPELKARLEQSAARLKITKHSLAQMAVEAAVEAIEENNNSLVIPVRFYFTTKDVPSLAPVPEGLDTSFLKAAETAAPAAPPGGPPPAGPISYKKNKPKKDKP